LGDSPVDEEEQADDTRSDITIPMLNASPMSDATPNKHIVEEAPRGASTSTYKLSNVAPAPYSPFKVPSTSSPTRSVGGGPINRSFISHTAPFRFNPIKATPASRSPSIKNTLVRSAPTTSLVGNSTRVQRLNVSDLSNTMSGIIRSASHSGNGTNGRIPASQSNITFFSNQTPRAQQSIDQSEAEDTPLRMNIEPVKTLECRICEKKDMTISSFVKHLTDRHDTTPAKEKLAFQCSCGFLGTNYTDVRIHIKSCRDHPSCSFTVVDRVDPLTTNH
ncbi:hypothetical protein PENTCL1PPCAC_7366, partial [Pristionchus entomophagus]